MADKEAYSIHGLSLTTGKPHPRPYNVGTKPTKSMYERCPTCNLKIRGKNHDAHCKPRDGKKK